MARLTHTAAPRAGIRRLAILTAVAFGLTACADDGSNPQATYAAQGGGVGLVLGVGLGCIIGQLASSRNGCARGAIIGGVGGAAVGAGLGAAQGGRTQNYAGLESVAQQDIQIAEQRLQEARSGREAAEVAVEENRYQLSLALQAYNQRASGPGEVQSAIRDAQRTQAQIEADRARTEQAIVELEGYLNSGIVQDPRHYEELEARRQQLMQERDRFARQLELLTSETERALDEINS